MGNIYIFGTDKRTCLRGMTAIDTIITVEALETFFLLIFPGIQYPDNRGQHGVGAEKVFMTAQAGRGTAETVDTSGSVNISVKEFRAYLVLFALPFWWFRVDYVWFDAVNALISDI